MPSNVNYTHQEWVNDETRLNATNMNNIDKGITDLISAMGNIPEWSLKPEKPTYTASEVGAVTASDVANSITSHNGASDAHAGVLAKKEHTHDLAEITDFPSASNDGDCVSAENGKWVAKPMSAVAYSGDYEDLSNTPEIPTKTSELDNDSGFVQLKDLKQTATSTYLGGYLTNAMRQFVWGFTPSSIVISKLDYADNVIDSITLTESYQDTTTTVTFTATGITMSSVSNGTFNKNGYKYKVSGISVGGFSPTLVVTLENMPSSLAYRQQTSGFIAQEGESEPPSRYTRPKVSDICEFAKASGVSSIVLRITDIDTIFTNGVDDWSYNNWSFPSDEVFLSLASIDYTDEVNATVSFAGTIACHRGISQETRVYNICVELCFNGEYEEITIRGTLLSGAKIGTFCIRSDEFGIISFNYEIGMTFEQFVASDYNINNMVSISSNNVKYTDAGEFVFTISDSVGPVDKTADIATQAIQGLLLVKDN